MARISMAVNRYNTKEGNRGIVKYFTASKVEVSIKQEPVKQAKYVFICRPPPNERMGMKKRYPEYLLGEDASKESCYKPEGKPLKELGGKVG